MKPYITKDKLIYSFTTAGKAILLNFIFSTVCFFLLWYWLTPKFFPLFPSFAAYLQGLDDGELMVAYDIYYTIASILAMFPGTALAYRFSAKQKKQFLKTSGGRISYGDGIRHHLTEHGISDGIAFFTVVLLFCVLSVIGESMGIGKAFPLTYYLCNAWGFLPGLLASVVLTGAASFSGVFFAQKKWRAEHFIGE